MFSPAGTNHSTVLLYFVDFRGNAGRIRNDFSIEYEGPVEVRRYVDSVYESTTCEEEAVEELLYEMPTDIAIDEVGRERANLLDEV